MLSHSSAISLSTDSLIHLAELIRAQRRARGTRWRRLDPAEQALLVLAHLRILPAPWRPTCAARRRSRHRRSG